MAYKRAEQIFRRTTIIFILDAITTDRIFCVFTYINFILFFFCYLEYATANRMNLDDDSFSLRSEQILAHKKKSGFEVKERFVQNRFFFFFAFYEHIEV